MGQAKENLQLLKENLISWNWIIDVKGVGKAEEN